MRQALHDPQIVKSQQLVAGLGAGQLPPGVLAAMVTHMLNSNAPDHTRLRRLVTAAFTRRRIEQLAPRIQQITDDLLSALVAVRDGADQLSEDELTSMASLLLVAGHETTVNLIGNGMLALLTHPEQLALLRAEPHRLDAACSPAFPGCAWPSHPNSSPGAPACSCTA